MTYKENIGDHIMHVTQAIAIMIKSGKQLSWWLEDMKFTEGDKFED